MFANTFQKGFVSIFYSVGSSPLQLWDKQVKNGHIRRVVDEEVKSLVLEISGTNVATTYITCPIKPRLSLGVRLPFLVMIIKNMKKYFTFEIQILDDKDMHRRFRVSNFQSTTKVRPFCTTMPIGLSSGWNQVQFNLADFTKRAYGSTYIETTRVQIHANVRIRRIYFSDVLYSDEELPNEYKLFVPTPGTQSIAKSLQEKKPSISKEEEGEKLSKKVPEDLQIQLEEQEINEAAFPSPAAGEETPQVSPQEEVLTEGEGEAPSEPLSNISEVAEPPSEMGEFTAEPTTEETEVTETTEGAESMHTEAPSEAHAGEGEAPATEEPAAEEPTGTEEPPPSEPAGEEAKPSEEAPPEEAAAVEGPAAEEASVAEEAPPETTVEAPSAPQEEDPAPTEEAPPAEETPAEALTEEAPAEAPPE